ncbi:MAG TPA: tetratricopeptide repeat protein [Kofleriaceae bacterium]|nr:tetratricopeptide repeat protein [Kofleriaceae bacterium]
MFRQQPDAKEFAVLRQELRDAGRGELLADVCATWAQHERDPIRAADAWSEAGEAMIVLGETATAIEYLRTALELDPTNDRASDRLLEIVEPNDPAAAVEILEAELAELGKRGATNKKPEAIARRAYQHRRVAALWNDHLGRVDRALWHFQQAWKLEPQRTEALEAARELYASLGDDAMVMKLYQAELDVLGKAPEHNAKKARLRLELGRVAQRRKELETAATHLEEAARLDPSSGEIAESLAEIYASPGFRDGPAQETARHKAGELFVELGKRRTERGDSTGINYLRRAVGVDPYAKASSRALEEALSTSSQWDELDRMLRHRTQVVQDADERRELLRRRAALYRTQLPNRDGLREVLTELVAYEPPGGKISGELKELLRDDAAWEPLSRLMEAEITALGQDPEISVDTIVAEILELATIAREHMGDRDRAAELLHQALGAAPQHEEALARYVDHFRERRDWRGLIDLYEFALDNARDAGESPSELVRRLEEIGQLAELRLGDIPRAIDAWQRIADLEPSSPKVSEALRRLTARGKMWEQLVVSLENEVASAGDPITRMQSLKKMAQTYRERQLEPRRAIELYEQVLTENPEDDATLKALAELYEKEGDDAGLAHTLRRTLDLDLDRLAAQMRKAGRAPDAAKEWPVAKRSERLTMLRRLAQLFEVRLADVDGVVFACSTILELLPGDRDALERMERVLDKANDPRLEQTLEYHVAAAGNPAERAKLLKRLAKMATDREDDVRALERWEQTMKASPSDPDALAALSSLYDRSERWPELAQVLERVDGGRPLPPPGTPEAAIRAGDLERYAIVLEQHLNDPVKAIKAWHRLLELTPKSRNALDALTRLYRAQSKWRELAEMLGRQIDVLLGSGFADDRERAAEIAMERAGLLEERLGAPNDAIKALDALLRDINPNHLEAHTALRRLHESRGDFDAAVRVAEREMYLSPEPIRKISRGLEIGFICRDRLGNPTRALQAFRRVLELDPDQEEAMAAAADLLAKLGRWKEHVQMLERLLQRNVAMAADRDPSESAVAADDRRTLVQRIAAATADKLGDPKAAFRWWRRAHDEAPDEQTLADVRRAGESYGLWRELAEVLTDERKRLVAAGGGVPAEVQRFVALSRELAGLLERRLGDKPRGVHVIAEAIAAAPRDGELLNELERLASELDQRPVWKLLLDSFELVLTASAPTERVDLYLRRARLLDERVGDPKAAVADVLAAFSWAPEREDIRAALEQLAAKARAWTDVVAVDSALIERAPSTEKRVVLLRRKAQTIEDQLKDAPRAYRSHLVALLLAPEDAETASHLWRLARVIGKYRDADKTPRAEPPSATIQAETSIAEAVASANRAGPVRAHRPHRLQTDPLSEADLGANLDVGDSTQPIDVDELELAEAKARQQAQQPAPNPFGGENATMTLSMNDIATLAIPPSPPSAPGRPSLPGVARLTGSTQTSKLPPPPPRPPKIEPGQRARRVSAPPPLPGMGRKPQVAVRRPPLPSLPNRAFESPWEELAVAYESLPAPDAVARLRWLFRASEVWESGAKDIARAFDALARAFAQTRRLAISSPPAVPGAPVANPNDAVGEVRARLSRIAAEHKAWDRLADLYENLAEEAETAQQAADLLMDVAQIRFEQKRPRETEAQLRRILGMLPNDVSSRARLEELYRNEGRWVELAASLEERTDPRLGTAAPETERPQLLRELAAIYTDKIHRSHDAIDAFERLRVLAPVDPRVMFKLAELYGAVGRWSKVIETLTRISEIAEGSDDARTAMRSIAQIYEKELELPERAIESYESVTQLWPDDDEAWAALDRLYQAQARWQELAEALRRRAGLARDPAERAHLLARRASVLSEWLDSPEEAAAALRHARTIAPEDSELADQMVGTLAKAGRDREAAALLEARLAAMEPNERGASKGDRAALLIRLAQLRLDKLDDRDGARAAIDEALALVPEHPTALAVLAQASSADEDPRAFADAKLREAESAQDEDNKIAALMAAGDVLHERVGDLGGAHAAYERVLALRPYHAEATWALAGLSEKGGDAEAATRVLEHKLEDETLTPPEKARLLTQLAALSRHAGVTPAAERRLLEALGTVPDHVPAIVALADFYADAERWNDLEAFLKEILDGTTLTGAPPALIADLHRRLATAHERLGRDEDAYQTLVAADRLHRGHLLIKLAIGENRYKARRWREATLHLSPLAAHDDAQRYPSEVAQGLYHAALAEIRSLRPEKAPALYQRALELKPNFAPALQALAELAMEQGDHKKAADLLTRQATATEDPGERMRLFEALGDMAMMILQDDERARACFAAAVAAAQPLEAKHLPLLEKLLARQDQAGDLAGCARTAELMAAFGATAVERAERHLRAAHDYFAAGDKVRARAAAERAVENDPYDVAAVDLASQLAIEQSDVEAAANMLTRLVNSKDDRFSAADAVQRALLSYRLGKARAERGDVRQAIPAYERAVALAPDSEGATNARRGLVELSKQSDDPDRKGIAAHLGAIVQQTGALSDLVAWADELRRHASSSAASTDAARATLELAVACGHTADVHQSAFLMSHKPYAMRDDESYKATLDDTDRAIVAAGEHAALATVAATVAEVAALVWPDLDEALARAGVSGARRALASSHAAAISMFPRLTTVLGAGAVMLYEHDSAADVTVVAAATPVIVLGPRVFGEHSELPSTTIRAILARAVDLTRPEHLAFAGLPPRDATRLLASIARLFGSAALRDAVSALMTEEDDAVQRAHDDAVKAAMPVKLRTRLEGVLAPLSPTALDNARYLAACYRDADRAALLVGGDPNVIVAGAKARGESLEYLIKAVGQPGWLATRQKLGVGIR